MINFIAILVGKIILTLTRFFNIGGGSAAPGLYALKIDPDFITHLSSKIPQNVIITGTNGKTTTSQLLTNFAKAQGLRVIRNHTGSNLERGIASALIRQSSVVSRQLVDLGIWEVDEAAFNTIAPKINPQFIIFLNAFRDQLDRYGEVDSVIKNWQKTLQKLDKNTVLLINGDDTNTEKLASSFTGKVLRFGLDKNKITGESATNQKISTLDVQAKDIKLSGLDSSSFQLQTTIYQLPTTLPLPGFYNIYNFLAAFALGLELKFESSKIVNSLKTFTSAFGRAEKFTLQPPGLKAKKQGFILLIKNPVGTTQVLQTLTPNLNPNDVLLIALNDQIADGTDVSWIWDVDFEQLSLRAKRGNLIFASGTRSYDLALRLKYAGFDPKQIVIEPDLNLAFKQAITGLKDTLYVLPTYTAMLELQSILTKSGVKKNYWEE